MAATFRFVGSYPSRYVGCNAGNVYLFMRNDPCPSFVHAEGIIAGGEFRSIVHTTAIPHPARLLPTSSGSRRSIADPRHFAGGLRLSLAGFQEGGLRCGGPGPVGGSDPG